MQVIRADAMGLCFGVRDALAAAAAIDDPQSVTIHGELVHNQQVLVELQTSGFHITPEASRDSSLPSTPRVLITAHGISDVERARLTSAGKQLIDTTCPLVHRVHRTAQNLAAEGFHVLVIGSADHVEVRGIVEDLEHYNILSQPTDVQSYANNRLGIVCQTTAPPRLVESIRKEVRRQNPAAEVRFIDTVCQPTIDRQQAVERLCRQVDVVVVVGGKSSNNTRRLAELASDRGVTAYHVQSADDLNPDWFTQGGPIGLTAGTSTLDTTIDEVYQTLRNLPEPTHTHPLNTPPLAVSQPSPHTQPVKPRPSVAPTAQPYTIPPSIHHNSAPHPSRLAMPDTIH